MPADLHLDHDAIERDLLKGEWVEGMVRDAATAIADTARGEVPDDVEIVVDEYETDRAAASVVIADARGRLFQVRDGVLTRAAAAHGLEVSDR